MSTPSTERVDSDRVNWERANWERVKALLHQAMHLAPEQRAAFLDEACSQNAALREEVESLLRAEDGVRLSFLESPISDSPISADESTPNGDGVAGTLTAGEIFAERQFDT